jgi:methionine aminotransferase
LVEDQYQRKLDPATEILVTAGATQAIFTAIQALVHNGDEVVIIDPAYDCYDPAVVLAGGRSVHVSMMPDFTIDWRGLREVISQKTKLLIVNNPHNPSGRVWTPDDYTSLIKLMEDHPKLLLLSDEVYEYITFELPHLSAHQHELLQQRAVVVSSFGKTFHITGWKVGYLVAPDTIMREIKKVHQFLVFSVNSITQKTLADYMGLVDVRSLGKFYQEKRDHFRKLLSDSKFELLPSEGTYFQTARYDRISSEHDVAFCEWLVKEIGVAAIPMSVFYDTHFDSKTIRFCFAKTNETLEAAAARLSVL